MKIHSSVVRRIVQSGAVAIGALLALFSFLVGMQIAQAESPLGCSADNSQVNIAKDVSVAEVGDSITFSVSAGNPGSVDGCDITGRTLTLTLPDGTVHAFGPSDYVNPTAVAVIGSVPYIADAADLVGGVWTANVSWNGTLQDIVPQVSTGSKNISVNEVMSLEVSKTAVPATEISYRWDIEKTVMPATWNLFMGDSGTSEYTIELTKDVVGTSYSVDGVITIYNPNDSESATVSSVADVISGYGTVDSLMCDETLPYVLGPGETLLCQYSSSLPDDSTRTNTVTVETTGFVSGGEGEAGIDFSNVVPTSNTADVSVDDTFDEGDAGPFSDSTSYTYTRAFICGEGQGEYSGVDNEVDNTATIIGTEISDSATVTVSCYDLEVEKTAVGTFDRAWTWDIVKTANTSSLMLAGDESQAVDYTVTVDAEYVDVGYNVSGEITITNNHPSVAADIVSVVDELGGVFPAVDCEGATSVPAGGQITCSYGPVDVETDLNEVIVTQRNYDYDKTGTPSLGGTTEYDASVAVDYSGPVNEMDECIDVSDSVAGVLGTVCAGEAPKSFQYSHTFGTGGENDVVLEACSEGSHPNVASYVTNDTGATGNDDWNVSWEIECVDFCSFSQGYWFAKPNVDWGEGVTLGGNVYDREAGLDIWNIKGKNSSHEAKHAFTQYSAIMLSAAESETVQADMPTDLTMALEYIENYFSGNPVLTSANIASFPKDKELRNASGFIGNWIDGNHCAG